MREWLALNWYWLATAIVIPLAAKLINHLTPHWSEKHGVSQIALLLIDLCDAIKLTPRPGQAAPPKNSAGSVTRGKLSMLLPLAFGAGVLVSGCTAQRFEDGLKIVHKQIDTMASASYKAFAMECYQRRQTCKAQGYKEALDCTPWIECDKARADVEKGVCAFEDALKLLDAAAKRAAKMGVLK